MKQPRSRNEDKRKRGITGGRKYRGIASAALPLRSLRRCGEEMMEDRGGKGGRTQKEQGEYRNEDKRRRGARKYREGREGN